MAGSPIRLDAWTKVQGSPTPLGATWVDSAQAWNFALYSTEATAVRLLIYGKDDFVNPIRSYDLDSVRQQDDSRVAHPGARLGRSRCPLLRLQGRRSAQSGRRSALRFRQGPARSLRARHLSASEFFTCRRDFSRSQRRHGAAGYSPGSRSPGDHPRQPSGATYARSDYLRTARAQLHQRSQLGPRRRHARHLRRRDCQNSLSEGAGYYRRRADAGSSVRSAGGQPLGLYDARLLRRAQWLRARRRRP